MHTHTLTHKHTHIYHTPPALEPVLLPVQPSLVAVPFLAQRHTPLPLPCVSQLLVFLFLYPYNCMLGGIRTRVHINTHDKRYTPLPLPCVSRLLIFIFMYMYTGIRVYTYVYISACAGNYVHTYIHTYTYKLTFKAAQYINPLMAI